MTSLRSSDLPTSRRTRRPAFRLLAAAVLTGGLGLAGPARADIIYDVVTLSAPGSNTLGEAWYINDNSQIVGQSYTGSDYPDPPVPAGTPIDQSVQWNYSGGLAPVGGIGLGSAGGFGTGSQAFGINNAGTIVGTTDYENVNYNYTAFSTPSNTPVSSGTDLGNLGGLAQLSGAQAINNNAIPTIAGFSDTPDFNATHATVWTNGVISDLGTLNPGDPFANSIAYGVNTAGFAVGSSQVALPGVSSQAFVASSGTGMQALANLTVDSTFGVARAINTAGLVAGQSDLANGQIRATVWQTSNGQGAPGSPTNLGTLGGDNSYGLGVNDAGKVVGSSYTASNTDLNAFLWNGTTMINLNDVSDVTAGWVLSEARSINSLGQIVGYGYLNGVKTAFLLTPKALPVVPEPATLVMLASAGLPLGVAALRRRRQAAKQA